MARSQKLAESIKANAASKALNRRRFLGRIAAAGASFAVVEPALLAGSQANSRIRVGCVGLGGRGRLIAGMLAEHPGYEVVSVADYFKEVADRAGDNLKVPPARRFSGLSGYRKLIDTGPDAVFLETPPCFFPLHASAAVAAGCHVYMAKPVAVDVPGCLEIADLGRKATSNRKVFLVDFQTRTDPFNIESVRQCHAGLIGKVGMLSSIYTDEAFADPPKTANIESRLQNLIWVNDIELGGGMLVNAGIHAIDLALWIARAVPKGAAGSARTCKTEPHGDTADVYSLTYQFENDLVLNHRGEHIDNLHGFTCGCTAYGRDGYMETGYQGKAWVRGKKGGYRGGEVENLYVDGISRNLDTFRSAIVDGVYDNPTVESSVNSTLATILGREASRRDTSITWEQIVREKRKIEPNLTGLRD